MKIDIICPLYNCSTYILTLNNSLLSQKGVDINNIIYILTESKDNSEKILNENRIEYELIKKEDFSHSLTREKYAKKSKSDIVCFISQDIVIDDGNWLKKLVSPIINGEADATYSRQISKYNNIEKYTREYNYPSNSTIKTKETIATKGLNTFFFSDACSAINNNVLRKVNYYDEKDLIINEDMYLAYKLIMGGYRIKYCADSVVYHSHNYSLKELFTRYRLTGIFFRQNTYLNVYKTVNSGKNLAKYIISEAIKRRDIKTILRFPFDMTARYIGMKVGMNNG